MELSSVQEQPINIGALVISTLCVAFIYLTIWTVRALKEGRLFPPVRERSVPWTGLQLVVLVLMVQFFLPTVVYVVARQTGLLTVPTHPGPSEAVDDGEKPPPNYTPEQVHEPDSLRRERSSIWLTAVTFPFQIATILGFLAFVSRARISDIGLAQRYFGRNVLLGVIGWLIFAPTVLLLNFAINLLYRGLIQAPVEEHPMMRLVQADPSTLDLILMVFIAVLAAPFLEELLFRGLLQPWFAGGATAG